MDRTYFGQVVLVGLGGFLGSSARFIASSLIHRWVPLAFPLGTFLVNIAGCLAIGFLGGLLEPGQSLGNSQRLFLVIGVLGGFTTFSSFAYETLSLAQSAELAKLAVNVAGQVLFGLAAAWIGYSAAQTM